MYCIGGVGCADTGDGSASPGCWASMALWAGAGADVSGNIGCICAGAPAGADGNTGWLCMGAPAGACWNAGWLWAVAGVPAENTGWFCAGSPIGTGGAPLPSLSCPMGNTGCGCGCAGAPAGNTGWLCMGAGPGVSGALLSPGPWLIGKACCGCADGPDCPSGPLPLGAPWPIGNTGCACCCAGAGAPAGNKGDPRGWKGPDTECSSSTVRTFINDPRLSACLGRSYPQEQKIALSRCYITMQGKWYTNS